MVVGASRGLGRGIAEAFAETGADVVAVARNGSQLQELVSSNGRIAAEAAVYAWRGKPGTGCAKCELRPWGYGI
jgi:NAD(P)-dependent dehydrogenase (short-subunit alcohol dehydrogenase family)